MSEDFIRFTVTPEAKKAFYIVLIVTVIAGLICIPIAIVTFNYRPRLTSNSFYMDYGEEETIPITAKEGQIIYLSVDTDGTFTVELLDSEDYEVDSIDFYYYEDELEYEVGETSDYSIYIKSYEDYAGIDVSYVVYTPRKGLAMFFTISIFIFPIGGMITGLIILAISDSRNK